MPVDTRNKRASVVQVLAHSTLAPPAPGGGVDQGDRQHTPHTYRGIAAVGEAVPRFRKLMGVGK